MGAGFDYSVVIPAYNAEKYIEEAVRSVLKQNWPGSLEIIVVDNNSSDKTAEAASKLPVTLMHEEKKGAAFARNKGIAAAAGEIIVLLDADDRFTDNAAKAMHTAMLGENKPDAVFGKAVDFISPELTEEEKTRFQLRPGSYGGVLPGCSMIKKSVFDRIGLFDTSLSSGETIDWQMRLRDSGIPSAQIDDVVLERRIHLTNTGRIAAADERKNYAALLRKRMMEKK